ncbi:mitochondrial peptide methionine sulfoxide reductase isoform X4 [Manis javanica]|uniref:mitochondrial peptide methionine sulfoxide reductase isoform X4 n=1 Tax=Manis javanica TaxID=9974 RepID=UPI003C6D2114
MPPAFKTVLQLFRSFFPVRRMGDSASKILSPAEALPGRKESITVAAKHHVNGNRTVEPFPEGAQMALFGMGCFWGAERKFWTLKGVYSTQVGYAGGYTSNPTYEEVCSGMRQGNDHGSQYRSAIYPTSAEHLEAALKSTEDYQKTSNSLPDSADPSHQHIFTALQPCSVTCCCGNKGRPPNVHGPWPFRMVYNKGVGHHHLRLAETPRRVGVEKLHNRKTGKVLSEHGYGPITTDVREGQPFYYAEDYHQQYLSKNPDGYCGLGGTGVSCPLGIKK